MSHLRGSLEALQTSSEALWADLEDLDPPPLHRASEGEEGEEEEEGAGTAALTIPSVVSSSWCPGDSGQAILSDNTPLTIKVSSTYARCTSFTASEGEAYCRANGMSAVSLDNSAKERELSGLLVR